MSSLEHLEHLKIPLNDINQATNNFAYENIIDKGAFGVVYKGELSGQILAFKRFTNAVGLQKSDFYKEVMFLSTIKHPNIISLVGFCDEDDEMILVLEHQTQGSLDMYLSSPRLTWSMRLDICLDIAQGLEYLQGDPQKIILGDLKSASIHLAYYRWPKIRFSNSFVMNLQLSSFNNFSNLGYVDPLYMETGRATKETDIYSFGVILFEVLCGRLATTKDEDKGWFLSRLACHHYENGTLTEIIDPVLRRQTNQDQLNVYSALAYRCLNMDPSIRPTATMVVQELQKVRKLRSIAVNTAHLPSSGQINTAHLPSSGQVNTAHFPSSGQVNTAHLPSSEQIVTCSMPTVSYALLDAGICSEQVWSLKFHKLAKQVPEVQKNGKIKFGPHTIHHMARMDLERTLEKCQNTPLKNPEITT